MDPISAVAQELANRIKASRTVSARGTVTAVSGSQVAFTIGGDPTPITGRWVGAAAPQVGQVIAYLDEGRGTPLVFGAFGQDTVGQQSSWTAYAPSWTSSGATPSVGGDGSLTGAYLRAAGWCEVQIHLRGGSATSWGSGGLRFSLPFASTPAVDYQTIGGTVLDAGIRHYPAAGVVLAGTTTAYAHFQMTAVSGALAPIVLEEVTATQPFTLAAGDMIHLHGRYRTA